MLFDAMLPALKRRRQAPAIFLLAVPWLFAASGCDTVTSGIATDADGRGYVLTERASPLLGGAASGGRTAIAKADAFCRARDQRVVPIDATDVGCRSSASSPARPARHCPFAAPRRGRNS
jgi:hypothetical protein